MRGAPAYCSVRHELGHPRPAPPLLRLQRLRRRLPVHRVQLQVGNAIVKGKPALILSLKVILW